MDKNENIKAIADLLTDLPPDSPIIPEFLNKCCAAYDKHIGANGLQGIARKLNRAGVSTEEFIQAIEAHNLIGDIPPLQDR